MTWQSPPHIADTTPGDGSLGSRLQSETLPALKDAVAPSTCFLWTGGKDAAVIADLLLYLVGTPGAAPVPFITIDTGNHYDSVKAYRESFTSATGDEGADTIGPPGGVASHSTIRYDALLEQVIEHPADPRGYHGRYTLPECPECAAVLCLDSATATSECPDCGFSHTAPDGFRSTFAKSEWDVAASCGALKTVPLRRLIEDHGFDTLITGRRGDDPLTPGGAGSLGTVRERTTPVSHTRVNPLAGWKEPHTWAYIKKESVPLPDIYTSEGFRHTDSMCCTDDDQSAVGEYGEGGRDPKKADARQRLEEMGYI